jgi:hypothetical protein
MFSRIIRGLGIDLTKQSTQAAAVDPAVTEPAPTFKRPAFHAPAPQAESVDDLMNGGPDYVEQAA